MWVWGLLPMIQNLAFSFPCENSHPTWNLSVVVKEITVNLGQNRSVLHKSTKICMKVDTKILKQ